MPDIDTPSEVLSDLLQIERRSASQFEVRLENFWGHALEAQALACIARAAIESCEGRELRSLQASFLTPPPARTPLRIELQPFEDDARTSRREMRLAGDACHCRVLACLVPDDGGVEYQLRRPDSSLPQPEELPSTAETAAEEGWSDYARGPVEFRRIGPLLPDRGTDLDQRQWVKPRAALPDRPELRAAAAVFLCDFYSHWAFERRVGAKFAQDHFQRLDQAICVHRAVHWDDWWLLVASSEVARAGVALGRRELYTRDGVLVASATQTALVATA